MLKRSGQIFKKLTGNSIVYREIRELQLEEKVIHDPRDIATTLNDYFIDSVKELTQSNCPRIEYHLPMLLNADKPFLNLCVVSQSQVDKAMCGLKRSKAKDAFCMDVTFLKYQMDSFITPLTTIINKSINESSFPEPWKCSVITPVFKSGNPAITSNYRLGISFFSFRLRYFHIAPNPNPDISRDWFSDTDFRYNFLCWQTTFNFLYIKK